ncbi:MAG TPA: TrkH family potassium uptake protein [Thermodesulfatator atlanticus]|uniref:TrkH family potassium uptake protein n=1 Tax=Thermodesulfatator atlanticus TaxID=501497 RepID=A0A7V5U3E9_9BACT|nr:TrkH family potassium uptake protein [Thermodesulfatator atlanticus]
MRIGTVLYILGWFLLFFSLALLVPGVVGLFYHESPKPFLAAAAISLGFGLSLMALLKPEKDIAYREGFAVVVFSWTAAGVFGALPFVFAGKLGFVDALFEAVSGFTTTGSTVFSSLEDLPRGLHFWRAFSQWLGGMGIIVLSLAILPLLGIGGMQLYQAEMPGLTKDKLAPRIQDTARILWGVYIFITLLEVLLLLAGGLSLYESVCHAFTTLATGGFSTRTASVAAFGSAYVDYVITVFMFLAGVNFSLHYRFLKGDLGAYFRNEEFRFYCLVGFLAVLICMIFNFVSDNYREIGPNLRYSLFQVWSIMTTTGYGTADFDLWHPVTRLLLLNLMFFGGMAGSTGGGIKQVRLLIFFKFIKLQFRKLIHPKAVEIIRYDEHKVSNEIIQAVLGFMALYALVFMVASLLVTAQGIDILTATSAVAATLNNIGPGLEGVGPTKNFGWLPGFSKLVLTFCMLAGRLELYTVVILFTRSYWRGLRFPLFRFPRRLSS